MTSDRFFDIMHRANELANKVYKGGDNNCEHFVNYSVFGEHKSVQAENVKLLADFGFKLEARLMLFPGDTGMELLDSINELRNEIGLKRKEEFSKIIEERKNLNKK